MLFEYYEVDFGDGSICRLENKHGVQIRLDAYPGIGISADYSSISAEEYPSNCGMIIMYDFWQASLEGIQKCISCLLEMAKTENYTKVIATTNGAQISVAGELKKLGFKKHRTWKARRTGSVITEWYYTIK